MTTPVMCVRVTTNELLVFKTRDSGDEYKDFYEKSEVSNGAPPIPHPLSQSKIYPTSFLTLHPLHAVSIYSSMKDSDRRVICMIAFSIPCINSAVGLNF